MKKKKKKNQCRQTVTIIIALGMRACISRKTLCAVASSEIYMKIYMTKMAYHRDHIFFYCMHADNPGRQRMVPAWY